MTYIYTLISLAALDSIWLFSMGSTYKAWLAHLFAPALTYLPIILFYPLYAAGVVFFVVAPALRNGASLWQVFLAGAFLGLICYAAYDLTNHGTLRDWPLIVTVVDMAWGTLLTGLASVAAVSLTNYLK